MRERTHERLHCSMVRAFFKVRRHFDPMAEKAPNCREKRKQPVRRPAAFLAFLYDVETKVFNQAVKRNERAFEVTNCDLKQKRRKAPPPLCIHGTGHRDALSGSRSDISVETSIRMNAFVETRRSLANNAALFSSASDKQS